MCGRLATIALGRPGTSRGIPPRREAVPRTLSLGAGSDRPVSSTWPDDCSHPCHVRSPSYRAIAECRHAAPFGVVGCRSSSAKSRHLGLHVCDAESRSRHPARPSRDSRTRVVERGLRKYALPRALRRVGRSSATPPYRGERQKNDLRNGPGPQGRARRARGQHPRPRDRRVGKRRYQFARCDGGRRPQRRFQTSRRRSRFREKVRALHFFAALDAVPTRALRPVERAIGPLDEAIDQKSARRVRGRCTDAEGQRPAFP